MLGLEVPTAELADAIGLLRELDDDAVSRGRPSRVGVLWGPAEKWLGDRGIRVGGDLHPNEEVEGPDLGIDL